jgi:2-polyprenyl-6-methoxyphenol hydroxylase-like FAD-dependent oxidoreductase
MSTAVRKVLVIGGGFSGMCAAIELRKRGIDVTLVEIDTGWRAYGAGITISGATLRALKAVGVVKEVMARGYCGDGVTLCTPDGTILGRLPTPRIAGPEVPGGGAIMRPVLAQILAEATRASGARVRLGLTFISIVQKDAHVEVHFSDGGSDQYDLVVGADGLASSVRGLVFPDVPSPKFTGQGVWRAVIPRPEELTHCHMYMGERLKVGINPVSQEQMYLFALEDRLDDAYVDPADWLPLLKALLTGYGHYIAAARENLGSHSQILYRPLEGMLLPLPWARGRVVLIGDAAHATTPHLASGAGIGIEDALVLAEELARGGHLDEALARFQSRRWERCRLVVENSLRLGEIEQTGGSTVEHANLMRDSMIALAQPI